MSSSVSSLGSAQIDSEIKSVETRLDAPITQLQDQQTTEKADISAWATIKSSVSSLSGALSGISDIASLSGRSVTSAGSSVATATATNSATTGTYALTNVTLAKAQEIYSSVIASGSKAAASAGDLTFTKNGTSKTVTVGSGSLTLAGLAAAINAASDGVVASVVNTQGGARLVLQSSATGSSQAFSISGTGGLAKFAYTPSSSANTVWKSGATAKDSTADINGVPVSQATNTLSDAVTGLTINLTGSSVDGTTLKVSASTSGLTSALSTVATSLNAAISSIATEVKFTPATSVSSGASASAAAKAGPLIGNFTATNLQSQLTTAVSGAAASGLSSNDIGLTVSSAGAVSFDTSTFDTAYAKNPTAVEALVTQIYKTLDTVTTGALGSSDSKSGGTIAAQTTALSNQVSSINSQIGLITKDNNAQLQILVEEYSIAEAAATSAQTTQAYLSIFTNSGSSTSSG
jgi:flagellar hook-associated protein 2